MIIQEEVLAAEILSSEQPSLKLGGAIYRETRNMTKSTLASAIVLLCFCAPIIWAQDEPDDQGDQNLGVTVQLPTLGVSIDTNGILTTQLMTDPGGKQIRDRLLNLKRQLPQDLQRRSQCRKISLKKLQAAIASNPLHIQTDESNTIHALAGLTRIEYVFVLPDLNDIVIAGPAEPWIKNLAGRRVGIFTARPTLNLEDLAVAIRSFSPTAKPNQWIACSIDPTAKGIQQLNQFNRNLPNQIPINLQAQAADHFRQQMRDALGLAEVKVYGIHPKTHAAHVLIEADYRMKLLAVGLEDPILNQLTTFIQALSGAPKDLQRWWLTPNYQCLQQTQDNLSVQFVGRGVRLQTENILLTQNANIQRKKTKPSRAARTYASSFTKNYEALSKVKPVFSQLRNVIDCLIAAAWIQKQDGWKKADLDPTIYVDESKIKTQTKPNVSKAKCVANAVWKNNVLLLPAGGGVSIAPAEALKSENLLKDKSKPLDDFAKKIQINHNDNWWWD